MRNIRLTIQYDGTNYSGWQSQKNSVAIQDVIEKAIAKLLGHKARIVGAGRTDAGVHAFGQVANFKTASRLSLESIKNGLNKHLPPDIVIIRSEDVDLDFHPQYDAKKKHYRYCITTQRAASPFYRNFTVPTRYDLDLDIMKREARQLLGRHDFSSFQGSNSKRQSAIRRVYRIDIKKKGNFIYVDIEADGFLYNMARVLVGTLIDIGRGYLKKGSAKRILRAKARRFGGSTAPAMGLSLVKVEY